MDWERQGVGPNAAGATAKDKGIPQIRVEKIDKAETNSGHLGLPQSKSDSDLGGSGGSMPNITFALNDAACCPADVQPEEENGLGRSGSKLNVYCSPRMSRRSFQDGDTNAGEQGCWLDGFEPSKSLLSLRSSVQLGSTTSLDTNFTGRSLGLLSDDSERTFLSDKPPTNSPTRKLLRRFFSDPENCPEGDTNINRSSQSWTNLKDAQMSFIDIDGVDERLVGDVVPTGEVDLDAVLDSLNHQEDSACQNLVSSRHTQKALSEGRIRQWLHDMNRDQQQQQPANDIPE